MSRLIIHVGGRFTDDAQRVLAAVARAEHGETIAPESHVSFENWETFFRTLTPSRIAVLRHIHTHRRRSVRALAQALARDYRGVHEDVAVLMAAGLIERQGAVLTTGCDVDQAEIEAA